MSHFDDFIIMGSKSNIFSFDWSSKVFLFYVTKIFHNYMCRVCLCV